MKNDVDKLSQFLVFLIIFIVLLAVTGLTIPAFGKVLVDFLICDERSRRHPQSIRYFQETLRKNQNTQKGEANSSAIILERPYQPP